MKHLNANLDSITNVEVNKDPDGIVRAVGVDSTNDVVAIPGVTYTAQDGTKFEVFCEERSVKTVAASGDGLLVDLTFDDGVVFDNVPAVGDVLDLYKASVLVDNKIPDGVNPEVQLIVGSTSTNAAGNFVIGVTPVDGQTVLALSIALITIELTDGLIATDCGTVAVTIEADGAVCILGDLIVGGKVLNKEGDDLLDGGGPGGGMDMDGDGDDFDEDDADEGTILCFDVIGDMIDPCFVAGSVITISKGTESIVGTITTVTSTTTTTGGGGGTNPGTDCFGYEEGDILSGSDTYYEWEIVAHDLNTLPGAVSFGGIGDHGIDWPWESPNGDTHWLFESHNEASNLPVLRRDDGTVSVLEEYGASVTYNVGRRIFGRFNPFWQNLADYNDTPIGDTVVTMRAASEGTTTLRKIGILNQVPALRWHFVTDGFAHEGAFQTGQGSAYGNGLSIPGETYVQFGKGISLTAPEIIEYYAAGGDIDREFNTLYSHYQIQDSDGNLIDDSAPFNIADVSLVRSGVANFDVGETFNYDGVTYHYNITSGGTAVWGLTAGSQTDDLCHADGITDAAGLGSTAVTTTTNEICFEVVSLQTADGEPFALTGALNISVICADGDGDVNSADVHIGGDLTVDGDVNFGDGQFGPFTIDNTDPNTLEVCLVDTVNDPAKPIIFKQGTSTTRTGDGFTHSNKGYKLSAEAFGTDPAENAKILSAPMVAGNIELRVTPNIDPLDNSKDDGHIIIPNGTTEVPLPPARTTKSLGIDEHGRLTAVGSSFTAAVNTLPNTTFSSTDPKALEAIPGNYNRITATGTYTLPVGAQGAIVIFKNPAPNPQIAGGFEYTIAPASGERIEFLPQNETLVVDNLQKTLVLQYTNGASGWLVR